MKSNVCTLSLALFLTIGGAASAQVVEFYNTNLNHFFVTADAVEAAAIDSGSAGPGWSRTGLSFNSGGVNQVCRFYGSSTINPATGMRRGPNSHFYTIDPAECAQVKLDPGWHFESNDFTSTAPVGGSCPGGRVPVYRAYNNRFAFNDSNHRLTASAAAYNAQVAAGWKGEGVVMCANSGLPSGGILKNNVIGVQRTATNTAITFELDVFVVNNTGQFYNSLNATAFSIDGFTGSGGTIGFSPPQAFLSAAQTYRGPYSALLVLDQSGSISSTDPGDTRIDATKVFLGALGTGEYAALAAFASGNPNYPSNPTILSGFTSSGPSLYPLVDSLKGRIDGGTPLYQSLLNSITFARNNGPTANRSVVVFTDGDDTIGGATIDQIVNASLAQQVPVFTVGLSNGTNVSVLGEIAARTNGALMQATDARQLVSIYGTLGKILSGTGQFYRVRWLATWNQVVGPGSTFSTSVKINTSDGLVYVPFGVTVP